MIHFEGRIQYFQGLNRQYSLRNQVQWTPIMFENWMKYPTNNEIVID